MVEDTHYLSEDDRRAWRSRLAEASRNNVLCHCRQCDREWVASGPEACTCGSRHIEWLNCWQFPDG
ncbi:MAG TPA: hypothetical protein V6D20_22755 [Candidatus Obscuribacterales bacterium]